MSINSEIYEDLKNRIISLEYKPGFMLNEFQLAKEYEVSRTPIREAIKNLEKLKLVNILPRRGSYVSQIDLKEFRDIFEVRTVLEGLVGQLAVERIDAAGVQQLRSLIDKIPYIRNSHDHIRFLQIDQLFHKILRDTSMNSELSEMLENYDVRSVRLWSYAIGKPAPAVESYLNDYVEFLKCIEARDTSGGRVLMENHVKISIAYMRERLI
jgi:DNA-binding GntR family transcriptional regulator